jgi:hypothetical protein
LTRDLYQAMEPSKSIFAKPVVRSASGRSVFEYFHRNHHDKPLVAWVLPDFSSVAEPADRPDPAAWRRELPMV